MWFFLNNNKKTINDLILVLPSFIIVFSITAYVVLNTLKESLGLIPELFLNELTFKYYIELFSSLVFIKSFMYSMFVALVSTALSTVIGTYFSYAISKTKNSFIDITYKFPIFMSYVAAAALIYNAFSDNGIVYHLIKLLGIEAGSLNVVYNVNGMAVILLNIFKGIPFIAFTLYPILLKTDAEYKETAKNLGCSNILYIFKVLLPLCRRAILSSALVIFNYNLFTYEGFYYLGPSVPPSIGVLAYQTYLNPDMTRRAVGMTINMVMIGISLLLCVIYYKLIRDKQRAGL